VWTDVTSRFDLDAAEVALLREVVRVVTLLDRLADLAAGVPAIDDDGRPAPILTEIRQQQITLGRLVAALRVPGDAAAIPNRPQRRTGFRGPYRVAGLPGAS
jgi:hypothetical protein